MRPGGKPLQAFSSDIEGVSAVEFALLLPILLMLYLGGVELSEALDANRKLTELARTLGDITAKSDEISGVELQQLAALSAPILAPHDPKSASVTLVAAWTDEKLASSVDWSFSATGMGVALGGAPAPSSPYDLPEHFTWKSRQTIVASVSFTYQPTFGAAITGPLRFSETVYFAPRSGKCVKRSDAGQRACNR